MAWEDDAEADTGFQKRGVGVSGYLLTTKSCCIRAHARNVFSPLYEVWGSAPVMSYSSERSQRLRVLYAFITFK